MPRRAAKPDSAANPYLAFSAVLAAGLKGIEEELELCPPMEEDSARGLSRQSCVHEGLDLCPTRLVKPWAVRRI